MNLQSMRLVLVAAALLSACVAVDANAQCCGQAATSYYAPAYTTAYAPAAYQSYYSGWYPGYWWDRASARVWGSPSTYVTSYRPAYYANYGYATSYAPVSTCSSCSAGYAPSTCSSCTAGYAPCSSCGTYTTSYAPACSTCASPCSSCSSCSSYAPAGCSSCSDTQVVTQASYQAPGCSTCSANAPAPSTTVVVQAPAAAAPQPTPAASEPPPSLGPNEPERTTTNRAADPAQPPAAQPEPGGDNKTVDPYKVEKSDNSTYLQPPKLFDPKDRTAQRGSIAPVRTALYQQPVSYRQMSAAARSPITAQQAQQDAIGWTSASK
jgi:hypothetical protein